MDTCCGGIDRNDRHMKEGEVPFMIRNCIQDNNEWSLVNCNKNCCGKKEATCTPTEEGGHCEYRDKYWKFNNKEKSFISINEALED